MSPLDPVAARAKTEEDIAARRVVSGAAWNEFCDTLKAAGAALHFPGAPQDPFNQAEGYRYLSRIARAGLMAFVEHADAKAPVLHRVVNEVTKLGADNPDNFSTRRPRWTAATSTGSPDNATPSRT